MRRSSVLLAALLIVGSLAGLAGPASASSVTARPASFCGDAKKLAKDLANVGVNDLTDSNIVKKFESALKKLQKQAPSSLQGAFKSVVNFYDKLVNGDLSLTDSGSAKELSKQAAKAGKAFTKIGKYLTSNCHLNLG